ncbi:hypothetical protein BGX26_000102 [Mortierella sp. AD094]|nr:hypothetical protein BGX26_000102 [Mortierella sp. AD094]
MSNLGYPQTGFSTTQFYSKAFAEADPNKRRRLFADARQSNLCSYQVYVLAAEAEEHWGADIVRLKTILAKGVTVFKNPAGQGAHCPRVSKGTWMQEAAGSKLRRHVLTAAALEQVVNESF